MGVRIWCVLFAFSLIPLAAAADESPVDISGVQTKDLKLYYKNYLSFLEPRVVRTFTNSLAWQRRMFGWMPSESTIILLRDFSDFGGADTDPRGSIFVSVSPKSNAFETVPVNELIYNLMNHEMIHVVQSDIANDEDRRWRKFFLGKVAASGRNPESILYSYLTMPRFTTPRWYAEGQAVFFETWMGGGLGRARDRQSGRKWAHSRVDSLQLPDNAPLYDPALVCRGSGRILRDLDGGWARSRSGRLRRNGFPGDGARQRLVLRPARTRVARNQGGLPDRGERVSLRHPLLYVARIHVLPGKGGTSGPGATSC